MLNTKGIFIFSFSLIFIAQYILLHNLYLKYIRLIVELNHNMTLIYTYIHIQKRLGSFNLI